ncbi:SpoIIE family protein phosphatase [Streptomyces antibioticus]|uniref:SpoIIE family protein phosphatase n=1 Tax=Streptomyces antibioticus TaxID=1890 RepID=UPI0033AAD034
MGTHDEGEVSRRRFDVADAAPLLLDAGGAVTSWTRRAEELLGYRAADAVGRGLERLLTEADALRAPEVLERARREGGWAGLLWARREDGGALPVMARITPAAEPGGVSRWLLLLSEVGEDAPGWNMSRSMLEQMLGGSPIGIAIVDTDLRFVWSNAALARFGGGPPRDRLGLRLADVQPGLDSEAIEAQMRRVLATGETVVGYEHLGHLRSAPHRETAHMMSFTRLDDDRGRPTGVYYTVVDITDRHRARQRLALLDRAGRRIGRTLDIVRTAQELADVTVPGFADAVTVDLLEPVLRGAEPTADGGPAEGVSLRRAGLRTAQWWGDAPDASPVDAGDLLAVSAGGGGRLTGSPAVAYPLGSPPARCLVTGRPWRGERAEGAGEAWTRALPPAGGAASVLIVPVRARGAVLGVTTFLRRRGREPFGEDDLALAEDLVSRAAVCVDNARRYTRERAAALVLQRNLLPHRLPEQDAVEASACYRPADELTGLGGDWYDLIPLSAARVALVVGEVPGFGIDAAAAMGRVRTAVRTLAALDLPPEEVLAHLDDLVARMAAEEDPASDGPDGSQAVGAGCLYVVYDPVGGRCVMAAAGHPAPAVVLPDGSVTFVELPQGPPLGAGGMPFEAAEMILPEGSVLALHTDGLLAKGGEEAGGTSVAGGVAGAASVAGTASVAEGAWEAAHAGEGGGTGKTGRVADAEQAGEATGAGRAADAGGAETATGTGDAREAEHAGKAGEAGKAEMPGEAREATEAEQTADAGGAETATDTGKAGVAGEASEAGHAREATEAEQAAVAEGARNATGAGKAGDAGEAEKAREPEHARKAPAAAQAADAEGAATATDAGEAGHAREPEHAEEAGKAKKPGQAREAGEAEQAADAGGAESAPYAREAGDAEEASEAGHAWEARGAGRTPDAETPGHARKAPEAEQTADAEGAETATDAGEAGHAEKAGRAGRTASTPLGERERLRRALERRAASLELRCQAVIDALVPDRPYDDVALLMARTRRLPPDRVAEWELPADPAAVAEARRTANRRLADWGLEELSFTTELVVSELVTNAIRYAAGPIRLRLIRERALTCEVFDGAATAPHPRHPRATDEGGRGLLLVSQLSRRWGTRFLPEGKVIWSEQPLTDPGV